MADSIKLFCQKCDQKLEIELVPGVRSISCPVCSSEIRIPIIEKIEDTHIEETGTQKKQINFEHLHQVFQADEKKESPDLPKFSPEPEKPTSKKSKKAPASKKPSSGKSQIKPTPSKKKKQARKPLLKPAKTPFEKYLKPLISALIVFIIIFAGYKFAMNEINKEKERKQQELLEHEAAMRERELKLEQSKKQKNAQWSSIVNAIQPSKLKTEQNFIDAVEKIKNFKGGNPNEKIKLLTKIKKQEKLCIASIIKNLQLEAESLAGEKKYEEAIALLQDYTGDFAKKTENARNKEANKYMDKLDEFAQEQELVAEREEDEKMLFLTDLCKDLLLEDYDSAKSLYNSSKYKSKYTDIANYLKNLQRIKKIVIDSFKKQVNKKITFSAMNKRHTMILKKVSLNGTLNFEYKNGTVKLIKKFSFSDLDTAEVITRFVKYDKTSALIYAGIKAAGIRKYDEAEKYLSDIDDLDIPFIAALDEMRDGNLIKKKTISKKEILSDEINFSKIKVECKFKNTSQQDPMKPETYTEKLKLNVNIKNKNKVTLSGITLKIFFIGKSPKKKYNLKIIHSYTKKIYIKSNGFFSKELSYKNTYSSPIELDVAGGTFGVNNAKGYKFYAWLWVLIGADGEELASGSNMKKFKLNPQKILQSKGKEFKNF